MQHQNILEPNNGAASGSDSVFNPYQECQAVHPTNGQRCQCRGLHAQHLAVFPDGEKRTIFSQWTGAPSFAPPVMTSGRVYSVWQKNLMKLAAVAVAGFIIWLAIWLVS